MRKRISLKTRRPDLTPQAFREHYENRHVPLGLSFIEHFGWRRYVRNHVLETRGRAVDFDCYTEFWVDDDFDDEALERFIGSPEFRVLDEDDRRFLDVDRRLSFEVRETPIEPESAAGAARIAIVWKRGGASHEEVRGMGQRIVSSLGSRVVAAMLDTSLAPLPAEAPFDSLLTVRLEDAEPVVLAPSAAPAAGWSLLVVDPVETPPELLDAARASHSPEERTRTCCP